MYLDATTRSLEILLGGSVTTNQLPCVAGWTDTTTTVVTPGTTRSISNNTTAVTAVAAPAASTQRQVQTLHVYNADTVDAAVTVRLNDNSTYANLVSVTLATGESLVYEARQGWQVIQADGALKTGIEGPQGIQGVQGDEGPQGPSVSDGDKGDITVSGSGGTWTIDNDAVTFAKMQNISTGVLIGRDAGTTSGDPQEITPDSDYGMFIGVATQELRFSPQNIPTGTAALLDTYAAYQSGTGVRQTTTNAILALLAPTPRGRLTLTTGTPVTTSDVTASSNLYYTPLDGNTIVLWNGTSWACYTFTEITTALSGLTSDRNYDVFAYINAGAVAIETLIWTNATTRGTGVSYQDGRLCLTGDKTKLYLGTFRSTSTTETCDTLAKRYLYNHYNRRSLPLYAFDNTNTWTVNSTTFAEVNAGSTEGTSRVGVVSGWGDCEIELLEQSFATATATNYSSGIGIDDATNIAQVYSGRAYGGAYARYDGFVPVGYHTYRRLEASAASVTVIGDNNVAYIQTGMTGKVVM